MSFVLTTTLRALALMVGMLVAIEVGRRIGKRVLARDPTGAFVGTGAVDGAVFGLLGLMLAFSFSGASSRFDARRQLMVEEANDIGTAYLRLDLLPASARDPLRALFGRYVDSRLETHRKLPDIVAAQAEFTKSTELQKEIWTQAVAACRAEGNPQATMMLLPALNAMIDITTTQLMASYMHPPVIVFVMLFGLAVAASLLAGYAMAGRATRDWLHMLGFAVAMAVSVYVIVDMEFPRLGFIRVDAFDQALVDVRQGMP